MVSAGWGAGWLVVVVFFLQAGETVAFAQDGDQSSRGEAIYREGRLPSGAMLHAERNGAVVEGREAACVNCHRRSGLGSYEGSVLIPPILGPYIFRRRPENVRDLTLPHIAGYVPNDYAYDAATLAVALGTGIAPDGRTLHSLMPHYSLDADSVRALSDYLNRLSSGPFPGVGEQTLEFATIVSPGTDPTERAAMLAVLDQFMKSQNTAVATRLQTVRSPGGAEYRTVRSWRLKVWQLSGQPEGWETQLQRLQAEDPVFAVISGLGGNTWAPVHRFCELNRVPCLFPNVDLPDVMEGDFYPLYFSRGVLLEGDLILAHIIARANQPGKATARIVQIFRGGDIGEAAAASLNRSALNSGVPVTNHRLAASIDAADERGRAVEARSRVQLRAALALVRPQDNLVLWLRSEDAAALGQHLPSAAVYVSGSMADLERAPLPLEWRERVRMAYPYDLPDQRRVRENFPHAWFSKHGIPVTSDRVQSNTYLSCMILSDALDEMLDAYVPDLLVERVENMLGRRSVTGYFPRLSLAPGQRFASKGGYVVKFEGKDHSVVVPDGIWLVP